MIYDIDEGALSAPEDTTPEEREAAAELLRCAADLYFGEDEHLPLSEAVSRLDYSFTDRVVRIADSAVAELMDQELYQDTRSWHQFALECLHAAEILEGR